MVRLNSTAVIRDSRQHNHVSHNGGFPSLCTSGLDAALTAPSVNDWECDSVCQEAGVGNLLGPIEAEIKKEKRETACFCAATPNFQLQ